jgi:hypothetical protein
MFMNIAIIAYRWEWLMTFTRLRSKMQQYCKSCICSMICPMGTDVIRTTNQMNKQYFKSKFLHKCKIFPTRDIFNYIINHNLFFCFLFWCWQEDNSCVLLLKFFNRYSKWDGLHLSCVRVYLQKYLHKFHE